MRATRDNERTRVRVKWKERERERDSALQTENEKERDKNVKSCKFNPEICGKNSGARVLFVSGEPKLVESGTS